MKPEKVNLERGLIELRAHGGRMRKTAFLRAVGVYPEKGQVERALRILFRRYKQAGIEIHTITEKVWTCVCLGPAPEAPPSPETESWEEPTEFVDLEPKRPKLKFYRAPGEPLMRPVDLNGIGGRDVLESSISHVWIDGVDLSPGAKAHSSTSDR